MLHVREPKEMLTDRSFRSAEGVVCRRSVLQTYCSRLVLSKFGAILPSREQL